MRFQAAGMISRPVHEVFAVLGDYRQDPLWRSGVADMDPQPPGPTRLGTSTRETLRILGATYTTPGSVTDYVADEVVSWKAEGDRLVASGTRRVQPVGDRATWVALTSQARLRGIRRVFEPLLAPIYRRRLRADLARLRSLVAS